jgi:hypothetical protein
MLTQSQPSQSPLTYTHICSRARARLHAYTHAHAHKRSSHVLFRGGVIHCRYGPYDMAGSAIDTSLIDPEFRMNVSESLKWEWSPPPCMNLGKSYQPNSLLTCHAPRALRRLCFLLHVSLSLPCMTVAHHCACLFLHPYNAAAHHHARITCGPLSCSDTQSSSSPPRTHHMRSLIVQ